MPMEISWEIRQRAEELYIYDGLSYERVANETGVSVSQLRRWGAAGDWKARKKAHRLALCDIRRYEMEAARGLMEKAAVSLDPQAAYAARSMAERILKQTEAPESPVKPDVNGLQRAINTPADAVEAIREVLELKLSAMIADPSAASLKELKAVKDGMALWKDLDAQHNPENTDAAPAGISPETVDAIRKNILGMQ